MHIKVGKLYTCEHECLCADHCDLFCINANDLFVALEDFPSDSESEIVRLKVLTAAGEVCQVVVFANSIKEAKLFTPCNML
jgi:hypothetical protein